MMMMTTTTLLHVLHPPLRQRPEKQIQLMDLSIYTEIKKNMTFEITHVDLN